MRGKGHEQTKRKGGVGITPAYAGKSHECDRIIKSGLDHPRLCGEKTVPE